jgi:hypothetical protein
MGVTGEPEGSTLRLKMLRELERTLAAQDPVSFHALAAVREMIMETEAEAPLRRANPDVPLRRRPR